MQLNEKKLRLLLVDDHGLFREGLGRLLSAEEDFELAGDFDSVAAAGEAMNSMRVDVLLLDFDLGDQTGLGLLEVLRARRFAGCVLIVTAGLSPSDTLRALELGVSGIFLKHRSPSDLITAIRRVAVGETWLDSGSVNTLVTAAVSAPREEAKPTTLTGREKDVLRAVFEGLTNKEIGARLEISEAYVKALMQHLFSKTGVRSRSQLVRVALEKRVLGGMIADS